MAWVGRWCRAVVAGHAKSVADALEDSCGNADPGARGRCDHACPGSGQHAAVVDERRPRRGTVRDTITPQRLPNMFC